MFYKRLKREDQGLSPRQSFINILKLYYTTVRIVSTLLHVLSNFYNV